MKPTFAGPEAYRNKDPYKLLPFRFMDFNDGKVVVNLVGEHQLLTNDDFSALINHRLDTDSLTYDALKGKHFLFDSGAATPVRLLATKLRTKYSFLAGFTRLHIFVVTLRCDHTCQYCQVSRVTAERSKYDMSTASADRALDLVYRAPARRLKIEFQGGEPLLNFELIKHVVESVAKRNAALVVERQKDIEFVITTNLSMLTNEILAFCAEHRIYISTSLDGPAFLHNANRPRPDRDSYERTVAGIRRVRQALGHDAVSALMTTTRASLEHPEAIVDEYVAQEFDHIFLRPLSPYGFAVRTKARTGYERHDFLDFYKRGLARIIEVNRAGTPMVEIYAQILLTKMLTPFATNYVDLQSPAGAGIGAVVYNYDGDVYASDEGRMLAEMGDKTFRLGALASNSFEEIFGGAVLRRLVAESMTDALPGCGDCAFQPYCGADPVEHHATQGDVVGHRPTSDFCRRNMGIIKHLLSLLHGKDAFVRDLLRSWASGVPLENGFPVPDA